MHLHIQEQVLQDLPLSTSEMRQQMERRDPVSGVPLAFLSIATRYTFPDDFIGLELHGNFSSLQNQPWCSAKSSDIICTGSTPEGLNLPPLCPREQEGIVSMSDIDTMLHFDLMEYFIVETSEEHSSLRPGFCYLRLTEDEDTILTNESALMYHYTKYDEGYFINTTFIDETVNELMREWVAPVTAYNLMQYNEPGPSTFRPAIKMSGSGREADLVPCLLIPWPRQASGWKNRERRNGWPGRELVDECIRYGCHVVNKAHPRSTGQSIEWRFSFSRAERELAQSLTNYQRMCYRVFKALVTHDKRGANEGLASYYLKITLFWVCEEVPSSHWNASNLGSMLLCLLDKLLHFLTRRFLPNYFIPKANLIDGITEEVLQRWTEFIHLVRREPLVALVQFHSRFKMVNDRVLAPDTVGTGIASLEIWSRDPHSSPTMESQILAVLEVIGIYFACVHDQGMALSVAKMAYSLTSKTCNFLTLNDNVELGENEELYLLITLYSMFIDKVNEDNIFIMDPVIPVLLNACKSEVLATLFAQTACFHYSLSKSTCLNDSVRQEHLKNTWIYFRRVADFEDRPFSASVQYAQFLMTQMLYKDALDLLKDTLCDSIELQDEETMESIYFSRFTDACMDEFLRFDVVAAANTRVRFYDQLLAYYLLMRCYSELKMPVTDSEVPLVSLFYERETDRERKAVEIEICHLEGCFCLSTGHVCEALHVFQLARYNLFQTSRPRIWYCVARIYLDMLPEVQCAMAEHRKQYSAWPLRITNRQMD